MKKALTAVVIILVAIALTNCNGSGGDTKTATAKTDTLPPSKDSIDLKHYLNLENYKGLDGKMRIDIITPVDTAEFHVDSALFTTNYINTPVFTPASKSFTFSVYDFYANLQTQLGLQNVSQSGAGTRVYNGVRIYPALDTTVASKQLYLVLMGEKSTAGPLTFTTMMANGQNAYTIKNNVWSNVVNPSAAYDQLTNDILAFQKVWQQKEGAATKDDINRSLCFSISEYYQMLNSIDSDMIKDTTNQNRTYKVALYPCAKDKKLHLVAKGLKNGVVVASRPFFNNMDVCPTKCPVTEVQ